MTATKKYREQSKLQSLNSYTQWVLYFFLREFPPHFATRLNASENTMWYINSYNRAVRDLKDSIKRDYVINKHSMLKEREKLDLYGREK